LLSGGGTFSNATGPLLFGDLRGGGGKGLLPSSFSGLERSHLFMNRRGEQFADISGISGLDDLADARAFALLDYDRDGWQDMATVNANAPLLQLFRNQISGSGEQYSDRTMLAIRFVGGNRSAAASKEWSNRDGIGTRVAIQTPGLKLIREHRAGEGFAAQNSSVMFIGLGAEKRVDSLTVRWPGGKTQTIENVAADTLITVYEDAQQSSTRQPFVTEPYRVGPSRKPIPHRLTSLRFPEARLVIPTATPKSGLRMFTTMETWCPSCKFWQAQVRNLAAAFSKEELHLFGVPTDKDDGKDKLDAYVQEFRPAYALISDATPADVGAVQQQSLGKFSRVVLPATVVTDSTGRVLLTREGVPSISEIRRLMAEQPAGGGRAVPADRLSSNMR
jgi:peroxiredoxin